MKSRSNRWYRTWQQSNNMNLAITMEKKRLFPDPETTRSWSSLWSSAQDFLNWSKAVKSCGAENLSMQWYRQEKHFFPMTPLTNDADDSLSLNFLDDSRLCLATRPRTHLRERPFPDAGPPSSSDPLNSVMGSKEGAPTSWSLSVKVSTLGRESSKASDIIPQQQHCRRSHDSSNTLHHTNFNTEQKIALSR